MARDESRPVALTGAAGYVTTSGAHVCQDCASDTDRLAAFRVGATQSPIVHPAPKGIYAPCKESEHYDKPCELCGWPIR